MFVHSFVLFMCIRCVYSTCGDIDTCCQREAPNRWACFSTCSCIVVNSQKLSTTENNVFIDIPSAVRTVNVVGNQLSVHLLVASMEQLWTTSLCKPGVVDVRWRETVNECGEFFFYIF